VKKKGKIKIVTSIHVHYAGWIDERLEFFEKMNHLFFFAWSRQGCIISPIITTIMLIAMALREASANTTKIIKVRGMQIKIAPAVTTGIF